MEDYTIANQTWWNEAAQIHARGEHYQLKDFKEGMIKLHALEREEVGDVKGKKLQAKRDDAFDVLVESHKALIIFIIY